MAQIINTNISSLNAQRNLNSSQSALATSLQRLSTGLRINSSKDDAAGLAISERMSTQIRGLTQAARNSNDGISLAQTAESALNEITENLQNIRRLAVQAANATNNANDRMALDAEVQQRLAEIDRSAVQTSFNGQRILDGSFGNAAFQVGANVGETINVGLNSSFRTNAIGQVARATSTAAAGVSDAALGNTGKIKVDEAEFGVKASTAGVGWGQSAASAWAKAQAINGSGITGLTATATNTIAFKVEDTGTSASVMSLTINGQAIFSGHDIEETQLTANDFATAINNNAAKTGVSAKISGSNLLLTAADGRDIAIAQHGGANGITAGSAVTVEGVLYRQGTIGGTIADATNGLTATATGGRNGGTISLSASENINITGIGTALGFATDAVTIAKDIKTLNSGDVKSVANANELINRIDSALEAASKMRSDFGAIQNRFESAIASLTSTSENLSAARSRIQDADFAAETAQLSRNQILQQAGIAMLSQANALPQNVLSLLK